MDNKVFKKLQKKFFYAPLAIGWVLIILACLFVFLVSRTKVMTSVENDLLKASAGPYLKSENYIYVIEMENLEPTTYYFTDFFTSEEIQAVIEQVVGAEPQRSSISSFVTSQGRRYMYIASAIKENGKPAVRYTIIDYTNSYNYIQTIGITLTCVCVVGMFVIFIFYYFFAKRAITPVKQSFIRQQELIANASHELKTPLTVVKTNLELIESDPSATVEDNKKWLNSAKYQIDRMQSLILDMLELTKLESGNINSEREDLQINDIVEGMTLSFEAICYEKSIMLDYQADDNICVRASKAEIEKIVGILLDNALKYTAQNGKITLILQKTRRYAIISITNTGEGIPQEKIDHIFDRFYKVDTSHKDTGNSFGLGLSIAKSIVDSLKGDISCQSQIGEYTRFTVELPISSQDFTLSRNKDNSKN